MNTNTPCPKCGQSVTVERTEFFESHLCEHCLDYCKVIPIEKCCSASDYQKVKYIISNGSIQVREQCRRCGFMTAQSIGGLTPTQREALPLADLLKKQRREEYVLSAGKGVYTKRAELFALRAMEKKEQWFEQYNEYLNSKEWKTKRYLVLQRDNYECQSCLQAKATEVHHKSYEFVDLNGSEPCFDLIAVCKPCHERIEAQKRANRIAKAS